MIGGYRIDGLISRGGMGMVYRATNLTLNRGYALKVIAPELAGDEEFRERFKREIRIAASLNHPNVVGIHYAGDDDGMLFLAMDYVDGTDLRELVAREGALAPERAVAILGQVTSALDAAHGKGLVHRDVKPANILITVNDGGEHAYLTDFGLAKRFDNATAMTVKGAVVGTVDYMPPEQITGDATDARTDVYALGCVFFQMLTGKVPYGREHSVATLFAHVYDPPPSLEGPAAAAHPTLGPVIAKAMAKASADRYASAGDFGRDAAAALLGGRYTGPPTIVGTGAARPGRGAEEHVVDGAPVTLEAMKAALGGSTDESEQASESVGGPSEGLSAEQAVKPGGGAQPEREAATADRSVGRGGPSSRGGWPIFAGLGVAAAAVAAVVVVVVSGGSSGSSGEPFGAALNPVPTNRVAASGSATIRLSGDVATVTVTTSGLLNGAPHLMHIHAGGQGLCPPATAARAHNGHLTISTTDAGRYYGAPVVSLTTVGDTSPRSIIDFTRYPTVGSIRYRRTISLPPSVVTDIRENNAVVIMHGIDYNGDGVYDDSLGISDLSNRLTAESTDPALCGSLAAVSAKVAGVGSGGPGRAAVYAAVLSPTARTAGMSGMGAAGGEMSSSSG